MMRIQEYRARWGFLYAPGFAFEPVQTPSPVDLKIALLLPTTHKEKGGGARRNLVLYARIENLGTRTLQFGVCLCV